MKYIKTYEILWQDTRIGYNNLKKYIIKKDDSGIYLYKFIETSNYQSATVKLLYHTKDNVTIKKDPRITGFSSISASEIENNIIYQTDDMNDCLQQFEIVKNTVKYNL